ncbi:SRPBCC family protein [Actinomyces bowdenii]|uniref:SRPBCC family protein n=1 Tax=Actinomyces bowdenii TaxID=131109 RepID=A0A853EMK2_9ACTO|nr:SRPBCC family protein [Actinomyces bowdenii]MBF0697319.1 SRPBCC family protein [Actinomyces bowdenii]MDO5064740.1 SRPBCC family protein [Actinomyces bowdenii]NYS69492.1 SRPBCC family protein [Actinomyces bowdenii]
MIRNIHERTIQAPASVLAPLLDGLGRDGDRLWPAGSWTPMVLDRPLAVGADGGHGPIRYRVVEYEPGRRVRFVFHPATGISGIHELAVEALGEDRCRMRHVLLGRARGAMRALFPLVVEPLHDAVIEDLLDNAEREATGRVRRPARHPAWVGLWSRLERGPGSGG